MTRQKNGFRLRIALCAAAALWMTGGPAAAEPDGSHTGAWHLAQTPSLGPAQAIGGYAHGCLAGGISLPLDGTGCYTVAGSQIWGKWNDNQMYDACNGCPCTPPDKTKCKSGPCKYPVCKCNEPCDAARRAQKCATS